MYRFQSCLLVFLSVSSICLAQDYVKFVNGLDGKTISITSDNLPAISNLNYMAASDYTPLTNSSTGQLSATIVDSNNNTLTSSPLLVTFNAQFTTVLVVMLNSTTVGLVTYDETISLTPNNDNVDNWIRVINAASGTLVNLVDSNSNTLFSNVGYLQGTNYAMFSSSVTKFLLSSNNNMSVTITPTFVAINNTNSNMTANILYTVVAFMSNSNGFGDGFYFDRSFMSAMNISSSNATTNSTTNSTSANATSTSSHVTSGHATTGIAVATAKATSGHVGNGTSTAKVTTGMSKSTSTSTSGNLPHLTSTTGAHTSGASQINYGYLAAIFAMIGLCFA